MFQFSPLASDSLWIQERMTEHDLRRVSPFGHPRINAYVRLPEAFRSLSRPSSPVRAKASTVRPCSLDRISTHAHRCAWSIRPTDPSCGHFTLVLAAVLVVLWLLGVLVLKLAGFAIHLLLIAGLILLVWGLVRRGASEVRRRV